MEESGRKPDARNQRVFLMPRELGLSRNAAWDAMPELLSCVGEADGALMTRTRNMT